MRFFDNFFYNGNSSSVCFAVNKFMLEENQFGWYRDMNDDAENKNLIWIELKNQYNSRFY